MNSEKAKKILANKIYSDTTLKSWKKEDLIEHIRVLEHNWQSSLASLDNSAKCCEELYEQNKKLKQSNKNILFVNEKVIERNQQLEEALLDMVVQFCQMGKEGYLHHAFMSAEENAFDVLDIEYGEKVDDVYKRFNERWGKE